jgi:hypothetical protein
MHRKIETERQVVLTTSGRTNKTNKKMFFLLLLTLAAAQNSAIENVAEFNALKTLFFNLNCTAPRCPVFNYTSPCPELVPPDALECANGNVVTIRLQSGPAPTLTGLIHGPSLAALTRLTELFLFNHTLTTIPTQIGRLTALTMLTLSVLSLTGTVPSEVGNLSNLVDLRLSINQLDGTLPALNRLTKLTRLRTNVNRLDGPLPAMPTTLRELLLSDCNFTALPPNLSGLTLLTGLNVVRNNFVGMPPNLTFSNLSCALQNVSAGETNCFDCPASGTLGDCFCFPKNAAKCDPAATTSRPTSMTTALPLMTSAADITLSPITFAPSPVSTTISPTTSANFSPSSSPSPSSTSTTSSNALPIPPSTDDGSWVVGVIVGGAVLAVLLVGLVIFCIFRCRRGQKASNNNSPAAAEMKQQLPPTDAQAQPDQSNYAMIPGSNYDHGHLDVDSSDYGHGRVDVDNAA